METRSLVHLDNFGFPFTKNDNVSTVDFTNDVIKRMSIFFDRCHAVGFQLNEVSVEEVANFSKAPREEQIRIIRSISSKKFTFLGVEYTIRKSPRTEGDFNTKGIAAKTLNKLNAVTAITFNKEAGQINPQISFRQLAMLTGTKNLTRTAPSTN